MLQYYEQRYPEYEAIYAKPERQVDLVWLEARIRELTSYKCVYEIACGTGYWTRRLASFAERVHATDVSQKLVDLAVSGCASDNVTSETADAFNIPKSQNFNCVLAGFFYSHVLIKQQSPFLKGLAESFLPGTRVVLFDNRYVEGSNTAVSRCSDEGDTYQTRLLSDGSSHEVLKNFPTESELKTTCAPFLRDLEVMECQYYWLVTGIISD